MKTSNFMNDMFTWPCLSHGIDLALTVNAFYTKLIDNGYIKMYARGINTKAWPSRQDTFIQSVKV